MFYALRYVGFRPTLGATSGGSLFWSGWLRNQAEDAVPRQMLHNHLGMCMWCFGGTCTFISHWAGRRMSVDVVSLAEVGTENVHLLWAPTAVSPHP